MEQSKGHSGGFLSSVMKMAAGGAVGQAIVLLSMPVLSRWYSPEDFGVLAIFTGLTAFLVAAASFRLEMAIPLPEQTERAADLTFLSLFLVLMTSIASALCVRWFGEAFSNWIGAPDLWTFLWFLPLAVFSLGCLQALGYWIARRKDFALLGASRTLQLGGQAGVQLAAGAAGLGAVGLILGFSAGPLMGLLLLLSRSGLSTENVFSRNWGKLASTYRKFFLFTTWAALLDVAALQLASLLLARCFSLEVAGYFALAMRIVSAPMILLSAAVTQVFYPTAAEHDRTTAGAKDLVERTASSLCLLSLAIFPLVMIHGPAIFGIVFGAAWIPAGSFARLLAPLMALAFIGSPIWTMFFVQGHQRQTLLFSCIMTASCVVSILVGAAFRSPAMAVALFSAGGVVIACFYLARAFELVGSNLASWLRRVRVFLLPALTLSAVLFLISLVLPPLLSFLLSLAAMGAFVYRYRGWISETVLPA
jgi:O-antigen/teichoic acid export membrane protein